MKNVLTRTLLLPALVAVAACTQLAFKESFYEAKIA
jgi:hypothetical protein